MKQSVMKGSISGLIPSIFVSTASCSSSKHFTTSSTVSSVINPAISSLWNASSSPSFQAVIPPPSSSSLFTALSISLSLSPTTIMLWESWAIVVAIAPCFIPYPLIRADAWYPVPWWRSITVTFKISSFSSWTHSPFSSLFTVASPFPVTTPPGRISIILALSDLRGSENVERETSFMLTDPLTPSGTTCGDFLMIFPSFATSSPFTYTSIGFISEMESTKKKSAKRPGVMAPLSHIW